MSTDPFENAEIIHSYSRAHAIADGVLIDITEHAQRFGFAYPVAVTRAVWIGVIRETSGAAQELNIRMLLNEAVDQARTGPRGDRRAFTYTKPATGETFPIVMRCGPGDTPEPVITLMDPLDD
ncbi:DUF6573 family protein [Tersicoccus sp. Bi-70]|uniref:DUF6573 family protein n=1 Tax=Tersicoccus sp. Bi-70 TaxID=1897634 RepID=UPI000976ACBE|nr:DUF6573 family protein [Tersicoccus sp. Bi-70]OMH34808.1 hypothetical protein BGP79_00020 [Tersicoccus sp. Bi-70]